MSALTARRAVPFVLIAGDLAVTTAFVYIGQVFHQTNVQDGSLWRLGQQTAAFAVAWLPLAWWLGALPEEPPRGGRALAGFMARTLAAWVFAAPLGLMLRAWLMNSATVVMPFAVATLEYGGLFMLCWRLAFAFAPAVWAIGRSAVRRGAGR